MAKKSKKPIEINEYGQPVDTELALEELFGRVDADIEQRANPRFIRYVRFCCDSWANIHSCRKEMVDLKRLRLEPGEWEQMSDEDKDGMVEDWARPATYFENETVGEWE